MHDFFTAMSFVLGMYGIGIFYRLFFDQTPKVLKAIEELRTEVSMLRSELDDYIRDNEPDPDDVSGHFGGMTRKQIRNYLDKQLG